MVFILSFFNLLLLLLLLLIFFLTIKSPKIKKSDWETRKELVAIGTNFFRAVGVLPVEMLPY